MADPLARLRRGNAGVGVLARQGVRRFQEVAQFVQAREHGLDQFAQHRVGPAFGVQMRAALVFRQVQHLGQQGVGAGLALFGTGHYVAIS